jgi:hypothetical protein
MTELCLGRPNFRPKLKVMQERLLPNKNASARLANVQGGTRPRNGPSYSADWEPCYVSQFQLRATCEVSST